MAENYKNPNCKWDSSKHDGKPCPKHGFGPSENAEVAPTVSEEQVKEAYEKTANEIKKFFKETSSLPFSEQIKKYEAYFKEGLLYDNPHVKTALNHWVDIYLNQKCFEENVEDAILEKMFSEAINPDIVVNDDVELDKLGIDYSVMTENEKGNMVYSLLIDLKSSSRDSFGVKLSCYANGGITPTGYLNPDSWTEAYCFLKTSMNKVATNEELYRVFRNNPEKMAHAMIDGYDAYMCNKKSFSEEMRKIVPDDDVQQFSECLLNKDFLGLKTLGFTRTQKYTWTKKYSDGITLNGYGIGKSFQVHLRIGKTVLDSNPKYLIFSEGDSKIE